MVCSHCDSTYKLASPGFLLSTQASSYLLPNSPFYLKQHLKSSLTNSLLLLNSHSSVCCLSLGLKIGEWAGNWNHRGCRPGKKRKSKLNEIMHAKRMFNQRAKRKLEITEKRKQLNVVLLQSVWSHACLCVFAGQRGCYSSVHISVLFYTSVNVYYTLT